MADHKVLDLGPGQIGEASYRTDERVWSFSQVFTDNELLEVVTPFQQCIPPTTLLGGEPSHAQARAQMKWLTKQYPETIPAKSVIQQFLRTSATTSPGLPYGALLAWGRASVDGKFKVGRSLPIFAMASGHDGHVLSIALPRMERHGWKGTSLGLSLMNPGMAETSEWSSIDGTIHQIAFAEDESGPRDWLALRQEHAINIFRPIYRTTSIASSALSSRVDPNFVTCLKNDSQASYVDVSFNPFYCRQFAVINEFGRWSTWDVGGRKQGSYALVCGKSGQLQDPDSASGEAAQVDGWFRILWAHDVSTMIVSSRRHIERVNIGATQSRLEFPGLTGTSDLIMDLKRSPTNISQLFVLTTSRIFWLELAQARINEDLASKDTVKVLLSFRHFRNAGDEGMNFTVSKTNEAAMVCLCSSKSPLVDIYTFSVNLEDGRPVSAHSSVSLLSIEQSIGFGLPDSVATICTTPAAFLRNHLHPKQKSGLDYPSLSIEFHQVWALTKNLGLHKSLCALKPTRTLNNELVRRPLLAPTTLRQIIRHHGLRAVDKDDFIVPDGQESDSVNDQRVSRRRRMAVGRKYRDDLRIRIDWRTIYEQAFGLPTYVSEVGAAQKEISPVSMTMADALERARHVISEGQVHGHLSLSTLSDMSGIGHISDDLEHVAQLMQEFLLAMKQQPDSDAAMMIVTSEILSHTPTRLSTSDSELSTTLMFIYDQLAEVWLSSLPSRVSGQARLAKHTSIRNVAIDMCLSSTAFSLRDRYSHPADVEEKYRGVQTPRTKDPDDMSLGSSPPLHSPSKSHSRVLSDEAHFSLPTPRQTPSLHSRNSSAASKRNTSSAEDLAVARLREYVPSIKALRNVSPMTSRLLSSWPSASGADPAGHRGEGLPSYEGHDSETSGRKRSSESQAPRRNRSQSLMDLDSGGDAKAASQPINPAFSSQPVGMSDAMFSSQVVEDIPMTQPDRGQHGSRDVKGGVSKKKKKRRAAGF